MSAGRAVLWDMDGTLIDSEQLHWIAWRNTLASEGITITREQFLSSFGQRNDSIIPRWLGAACDSRAHRENRRSQGGTVPSSGSQRRHLTTAWSCNTGCTGFTKRDGCRPSPQRRRVRISMQFLKLYRLPTSFKPSSLPKMCTEANRIQKCI